MTKKELLIIFLLAVLVTGGSWLYCVPGKGTVYLGSVKFCGWPLAYYQHFQELDLRGVSIFRQEFLVNLLFWFLVLASGLGVIKKRIKNN